MKFILPEIVGILYCSALKVLLLLELAVPLLSVALSTKSTY